MFLVGLVWLLVVVHSNAALGRHKPQQFLRLSITACDSEQCDFHKGGVMWSFVVVVNCGRLWSFVVVCGQLWSTVVNCGQLWSIVVNWDRWHRRLAQRI